MKLPDSVSSYLFAETNAGVYAILDGASADGLLDRLRQYEPECECLYRGELAPDLAEVAPYLVRLDRRSAFTDWVVTRGWGKHWGVFGVSRADLPAMRRHFRRFLTVHDSAGKPLLFRYYDPRVLRAYLPTCTSAELTDIFGPVMHYIVEGENPAELLRFQLAGGALAFNTKNLEEES
jgi:hypothetical protein